MGGIENVSRGRPANQSSASSPSMSEVEFVLLAGRFLFLPLLESDRRPDGVPAVLEELGVPFGDRHVERALPSPPPNSFERSILSPATSPSPRRCRRTCAAGR